MKNLFAVIFALCTMLSVALPGHAGPGRPSFSARSTYSGGFRSSSSPSYRSFSTTPSRSYTYKASAPSSPAPAATPRTYSYNPPVQARPISRSTIKNTTVNNHYHGDGGHSGGGGMSLMDYAVISSLTSHNNSPTYVNTQPAVVAAQPAPVMVSASDYDAPAMIYQQEESHFWRNFFLSIVGVTVVAGAIVAFVRWLEADRD